MLIITMREKYKHKIQAFGTNSGPNMKIENREKFTDSSLAIHPSGT